MCDSTFILFFWNISVKLKRKEKREPQSFFPRSCWSPLSTHAPWARLLEAAPRWLYGSPSASRPCRLLLLLPQSRGDQHVPADVSPPKRCGSSSHGGQGRPSSLEALPLDRAVSTVLTLVVEAFYARISIFTYAERFAMKHLLLEILLLISFLFVGFVSCLSVA